MTGMCCVVRWVAGLMAVVASCASSAAEWPGERDYVKAVAACGKSPANQVSFFNAFGGIWPVPTNFVLVDIANNRLEYNDLAYPWYEATKTSHIFFGGRASLERRWPNLFSRRDGLTTQKCSLQVTKYEHWDSFDAPVVVISNSRDHLLLVGPIVDASTAALDCYASTARLRGTVCN